MKMRQRKEQGTPVSSPADVGPSLPLMLSGGAAEQCCPARGGGVSGSSRK